MTAEPQQLLFIGLGFLSAVVLFYVVQVGKRMRKLLAVKLKRVVLSLALCAIAGSVCTSQGYSTAQTIVISLSAMLLPLWLIPSPKKSRYIPANVKQTVLASSDVDYDPKRHHLDHIVPLSKGGDTSAANLRVLTRGANLRKGAKMPRLKDFL